MTCLSGQNGRKYYLDIYLRFGYTSAMKKSVSISLIVLLAVAAIAGNVVPVFLVAAQSVDAANFSDHLTTITHNGERYHILPESKLDETIIIIDKQGKEHYILDKEKIQLLGPKLLTGVE